MTTCKKCQVPQRTSDQSPPGLAQFGHAPFNTVKNVNHIRSRIRAINASSEKGPAMNRRCCKILSPSESEIKSEMHTVGSNEKNLSILPLPDQKCLPCRRSSKDHHHQQIMHACPEQYQPAQVLGVKALFPPISSTMSQFTNSSPAGQHASLLQWLWVDFEIHHQQKALLIEKTPISDKPLSSPATAVAIDVRPGAEGQRSFSNKP